MSSLNRFPTDGKAPPRVLSFHPASNEFRGYFETKRQKMKTILVALASLIIANTVQAGNDWYEHLGDSPASPTSNPTGGIIGLIIGAVVLVLILRACVKKGSGVSNTPAPAILIENETETQALVLKALNTGTDLPCINVEGFLAKPKEKVLWVWERVKHYHQGVHSEWVGRRQGASVRIAKGLWWHKGVNHGHRVTHTEMDYKGEGYLILTNQGFSFISPEYPQGFRSRMSWDSRRTMTV